MNLREVAELSTVTTGPNPDSSIQSLIVKAS